MNTNKDTYDFTDEELANEQWKTVEGFPDYKISNLGRVRSPLCILISRPNNKGYTIVNLRKDKKPYTKTVHRLVALAFVDNPNGYPEVNHIDGNKENNRASNLEWCTRSQNNKHALNNGLRANPNPPALTPKQEKEAKIAYKNGATRVELGAKYHVHPDSMKKYLKGVYKQRPVPPEIKIEIQRVFKTGLYKIDELEFIYDIPKSTIENIVYGR